MLAIKTYFTPFSSVSIVDFEQVNVGLDIYCKMTHNTIIG